MEDTRQTKSQILTYRQIKIEYHVDLFIRLQENCLQRIRFTGLSRHYSILGVLNCLIHRFHPEYREEGKWLRKATSYISKH